MSDLLLMQKSIVAIYKCCMFRYTVHYNLPQGPFVLYVYYFSSTNDILSFSPKNDDLMIVYIINYRGEVFRQWWCKPL
jgi:hypothetical protein